MRAALPTEALRGVTRRARVALPVRANDEVTLEDETSHLSVHFALDNVHDTHIEVADGMALYRGALDGADVVHRVHAEGTEDFVVFEQRPAREELSYSVDVSRVPGLRLVSNTLEFLDEAGTPLLRVAPPYMVDAVGQRHDAKLAVNGCAYDTSPAAPWGRRVTTPGAARCTVHVAWAGAIVYPAMLDPAWGATGSMATARWVHTESVLASGNVLVVGGASTGVGVTLASAELFDPAGNAGQGTFAATGPMGVARWGHTASVLASNAVLVVGGVTAGGMTVLASAELYHPGAGTFAPTGSMALARLYHTASVLPSGKVLVAGGGTGGWSASAELFEPAGNAGAGSFASTGAMPSARGYHTASVLASGKVLLAAGVGSGGAVLASAALFDPAGNAGAGTFTATGAMGAARRFHTASVLASGKVLVAGGRDKVGPLGSAELFDPAGNAGAGTFAATAPLATARDGHSASVFASGKVLLAGGQGQVGVFHASTELFDPAGNAGAGAFVTGSMAAARGGHTASVLPTGQVLVAGGYNGNALASAELLGDGALGEACAQGGCLSGFCVDGYCCNAACSGSCDTCNQAGKLGQCSPVSAGNVGANPACAGAVCDGLQGDCPTPCATDSACERTQYCASSGTCQPRKARGMACNPPLSCKVAGCRECFDPDTDGFCADGVCCDTACNGTCQACVAALKQSGVASGTCGATKSGLDPHNECTAESTPCGADGQCNGTGACHGRQPAGVSCGAGQCSGTVALGQILRWLGDLHREPNRHRVCALPVRERWLRDVVRNELAVRRLGVVRGGHLYAEGVERRRVPFGGGMLERVLRRRRLLRPSVRRSVRSLRFRRRHVWPDLRQASRSPSALLRGLRVQRGGRRLPTAAGGDDLRRRSHEVPPSAGGLGEPAGGVRATAGAARSGEGKAAAQGKVPGSPQWWVCCSCSGGGVHCLNTRRPRRRC